MQTLDAVRNQMREAEPVLKALDSELENISFDPGKRESIDSAIAQVILVIDTRLEAFKINPILGPMAEDLKVQYVEGIRAQAAECPLEQA